MATLYNDLEFKLEDAIEAFLTPTAQALTLPLKKSLNSDSLETEHIAIIAEEGTPSAGIQNLGNYAIPVRFKVVTAVDQASNVNVRDLHRQRAGQIRDALCVDDLADQLSALVDNFTVGDWTLGKFDQKIVGRNWITTFWIEFDPVCGSDL